MGTFEIPRIEGCRKGKENVDYRGMTMGPENRAEYLKGMGRNEK
jgi:hypothetical protein